MKNAMTCLRVVVLGLFFTVAAQAYTFYFNSGSIERNDTFDAATGGYVGAVSALAPATSLRVHTDYGSPVTEIVVNTYSVAPGTYYVGTIPGGEDIYVEVL